MNIHYTISTTYICALLYGGFDRVLALEEVYRLRLVIGQEHL